MDPRPGLPGGEHYFLQILREKEKKTGERSGAAGEDGGELVS